ncbi:MAG: coproporphyrinogen III oxidase [Bacteroidetes bacterium MedPE-SWsnd-G2]|nr:MAG: coproporphyrinogen III oxidase [Bacteroidetes bacterium MedPE-SWsnd-G2]
MAGIYLHIPFCKQACFYCDFHFSTNFGKKSEMVEAIKKELSLRANELEGQKIETIYFGGGTPSVLSIDEIQDLLKAIKDQFEVTNSPEITLEANPDDLDSETLQKLSKTAINRLSIGVQSFNENDLKIMNRAHNGTEAIECLKEASQLFDNITIDLIYGVPGMTLEQWDLNIRTALRFGVNHISSYALTVEPKTVLAHKIKKGEYDNPDEAEAAKHFHHLVDVCNSEGFVHYEISNFGKPDYFSKHNTSYWKGVDYLGVGPSAHSFNGKQRSWNISNNSKYLKAINANQLPLTIEDLTVSDQYNEYVMTGLRTIWGVSFTVILEKFGASYLSHMQLCAQPFIDNGKLKLITKNDNQFLLTTEQGKFFADGIASELFMI